MLATFEFQRHVVAAGYDRKTCWVHARCGFLPPHEEGGEETMVITLQKSLMASEDHVHDHFSGLFSMTSKDGGQSWSEPMAQPHLARWVEADGVEGTICDFTPQWHVGSGRLLGIGVTSRYRDGRAVLSPARRETVYSVYDRETDEWGPAHCLDLPGLSFSGAGCVQWSELENGDLLLPICFREDGDPFSVRVLRCGFDGARLEIKELGDVLSLPVERGFVEPSIIECAGRFWLTLRNDLGGYVACSKDGLAYTAYSTPRPWLFDDGTPLGSCNTQQHWIVLDQQLFLVYTRHGLDNDHVPRHRAPLVMAEVDQERGVIVRESEVILVPERGAQLGNFGAITRHRNEAWVCVSEWMENAGAWDHNLWGALRRKFPGVNLDVHAATPGRCGLCELSGSDNRIYLVKITR